MLAYPTGTVSTLIESKNVSVPTRQALQQRMAGTHTDKPLFLNEPSFGTLRAICGRLIQRDGTAGQVDIAGQIDSALADGTGNGWRYDALPPDAQTYQLGLAGCDQTASVFFGALFVQLEDIQQDSVLRAVQQGNAPGNVWQKIPSTLFFKVLLAFAVEICYGHPLVQESIGYAGMADVPGWQLLELNQLEAREPRLLPTKNG